MNEKKRIRVMLGEEVSSIDKVFNLRGGDSYPSLRIRKANTTVELGDGESFILGGLISSTERESLKKFRLLVMSPYWVRYSVMHKLRGIRVSWWLSLP